MSKVPANARVAGLFECEPECAGTGVVLDALQVIRDRSCPANRSNLMLASSSVFCNRMGGARGRSLCPIDALGPRSPPSQGLKQGFDSPRERAPMISKTYRKISSATKSPTKYGPGVKWRPTIGPL
jgi:hypothetical protein